MIPTKKDSPVAATTRGEASNKTKVTCDNSTKLKHWTIGQYDFIAAAKHLGLTEAEFFMVRAAKKLGSRATSKIYQIKIESGAVQVWGTDLVKGNWERKTLAGDFSILWELGLTGWDLFWYPHNPQDGIGVVNCADTGHRFIWGECDDRTLEDQVKMFKDLSARGFKPSALIYSGSKSYHFYAALDEGIGIEEQTELLRLAAIALGSDPAVASKARAMRIAGVYRVKNNTWKYCTSKLGQTTYTYAELRQWLSVLIKEKFGILPPDHFSVNRYRAYKRAIAAGDSQALLESLIAPEFEFEQQFDGIDLDDLPLELIQPIARKALATIPESIPGESTYEAIFRPLAGGLKKVFGDAMAISLLEDHSPQRDAAGAVASIKQYNVASVFKVAREYGGFFWTEDDAEPVIAYYHDDIVRAYAKLKGKELSLALSTLRKKIHLLGCPDKYWKAECNAIAADADVSPVYGADEEWWSLKEQGLIGFGGSRGEGQERDTPDWIHENLIAPYIKRLKNLGKNALSFEDPIQSRIFISPDAVSDHDGTQYVVPFQNEQQRLDIVKYALSLGYKAVIDISGTGVGKTWQLTQDEWRGEKLSVMLPSHRNPHVEKLSLFHEMPTRHNGLYRHSDGMLRRSPQFDNQAPERKSICDKADQFIEGYAVGRNMEIDSPCFSCEHFEVCSWQDPSLTDEEGYGFRYLRSIALKQRKIRAHISQYQSVPSELLADRIAVVDEFGSQLGGVKKMTISFEEIDRKLAFLNSQHPGKADIFRPFFNHIKDLSLSSTSPFGVTHDEIFSNAPKACSFEDRAWVKGAMTAIAQGRIDWELATEISLRDEAGQATPFEPFSDIIKIWEAIGNRHLYSLKDGQGSISVHGTTVTVTMRDTTDIETLKKFGGGILLMDATPDIETLAELWGCEPSEFLVITRPQPDNSGLTVTVVDTPGTGSRQNLFNSPQAQDRVCNVVNALKEATNDPSAMVIGMKGCPIPHDGYWGNDSRGTNKFNGVSTLIAYGLPYPNVGACQDDYRAIHGSLEGFERYYNHIVSAEIVQVVGRQRAHRHDREFNLFLIATNFDPSFLLSLGCKVNMIHAADLNPKFGSQSQQARHRLLSVAKDLIATGQQLTQQALADTLGFSQQAVSDLVKGIQGGWKAFKEILLKFKIQGDLIEANKADLYSPELDDWLGFTPLVASSIIAPILLNKDWTSLSDLINGTTPSKRSWVLAIALNLFSLNPGISAQERPPNTQ